MHRCEELYSRFLVAFGRSGAPLLSMGEREDDLTNDTNGWTVASPKGSGGSLSTRRPLLSPEDLASYLAVPLATVYRWRSRREGPRGIRVGRHVRYHVDDVERWLDDRREQRP
jgi:excisionase family DNA binding protein